MNNLKEWWNTERQGRIEKGTSQDFCPTNGGAIIYASTIILISVIPLIIFMWVME